MHTLVDIDEVLEEIQLIIFEYQICRIIAIHGRYILLRLECFFKLHQSVNLREPYPFHFPQAIVLIDLYSSFYSLCFCSGPWKHLNLRRASFLWSTGFLSMQVCEIYELMCKDYKLPLS